MKKLTVGLLVFAAILSVGALILSYTYTHSVSEELTLLRRESRNDLVYLRSRVKDLESELQLLRDETKEPTFDAEEPVTETEPLPETDIPTEPPVTEAVTIPSQHAPETQPPAPESDTTPVRYLITEHNGIIGVFDEDGTLVHTVNVFVMTLPAADREALAAGIPAHSAEELEEIIKRYE